MIRNLCPGEGKMNGGCLKTMWSDVRSRVDLPLYDHQSLVLYFMLYISIFPLSPFFNRPFPFPVFACGKKSSYCNSLILMVVLINLHYFWKKVVKKFGKGIIVGLSLQPQSGTTVLYRWCRWRGGTFWYRGITDCKSSYQWLANRGSKKTSEILHRKFGR